MKNIKVVFSVLCFLSIFSVSVIAQPKNDRTEKKLERLTKELSLTESQQEQIKVIFKKEEETRQAIKVQEGDRDSKKQAFKAHQQAQMKAVKSVLNKEQLVIFQKMADNRKEHQQKGRRDRKAHYESFKNVDKKALIAEIKAYKEKNIKPVLMAQRQKLEVQISSEDKKTINRLRVAFKELKEDGQELKGNHKEGKKPTEANKKAFEALKTRKKALMSEVQVLLEKYKPQIKALKTEIKPQNEQWKKDTKAIAQKHGVKHKEKGVENNEKQKVTPSPSKRRHKRRKHHSKKQQKQFSPVLFLLMDVNSKDDNRSDKKTSTSNMRVYPNPAQGQNTIEFELASAGKISLELHDTKGNLIKIITKGYKEAGTYKEEVNLGDLKDYVYFYILKDTNGNVLTEKFVIKR